MADVLIQDLTPCFFRPIELDSQRTGHLVMLSHNGRCVNASFAPSNSIRSERGIW